VVADGVETGRQLKLLDGMGCDAIQGYLFFAFARGAGGGGVASIADSAAIGTSDLGEWIRAAKLH
jgi:EAL domain-containing protein (putative c-di-GMP-specific phosphodiesterase class I)